MEIVIDARETHLFQLGYDEGYKEGYEEGYAEGYAEGKAEIGKKAVRLFQKLGVSPEKTAQEMELSLAEVRAFLADE